MLKWDVEEYETSEALKAALNILSRGKWTVYRVFIKPNGLFVVVACKHVEEDK